VLTQSFSGTQHHLTDDGMDTGENTDDNDGPWITSANKRRRKDLPLDIRSSNQRPSQRAKPSRVKILGKSNTCTLKAAKSLTKNRIFCVSNIAPNTTCDDLTNWIISCGIKVNNVFVAKTKFKDTIAFRINIDANDSDKFLSEDTWSSDIIIRDWVFKSNLSEHPSA